MVIDSRDKQQQYGRKPWKTRRMQYTSRLDLSASYSHSITGTLVEQCFLIFVNSFLGEDRASSLSILSRPDRCRWYFCRRNSSTMQTATLYFNSRNAVTMPSPMLLLSRIRKCHMPSFFHATIQLAPVCNFSFFCYNDPYDSSSV